MYKKFLFTLLSVFAMTQSIEKALATDQDKPGGFTALCKVYQSPCPENALREIRWPDEDSGLKSKLRMLPWATLLTFTTFAGRRLCEAYLPTAATSFWTTAAKLVVDYIPNSPGLAMVTAGAVDSFYHFVLADFLKPQHIAVEVIEKVDGQKPVVLTFTLTQKENEDFKAMRLARMKEIHGELAGILQQYNNDVQEALTRIMKKYNMTNEASLLANPLNHSS